MMSTRKRIGFSLIFAAIAVGFLSMGLLWANGEENAAATPAADSIWAKTIDNDAWVLNASLKFSGEKNSGILTLALVPKKGHKVNKDYPAKVSLTGSEGVTVAETFKKDAAKTVSEHELTFEIPYTVNSGATAASLAIEFKFGVCDLNDAGEVTRCAFFKEKHTIPATASK